MQVPTDPARVAATTVFGIMLALLGVTGQSGFPSMAARVCPPIGKDSVCLPMGSRMSLPIIFPNWFVRKGTLATVSCHLSVEAVD